MPLETREMLGKVLVYDGANTAEVAELLKLDTVPTPDENDAIEVLVPMPFGPASATLNLGDGLVARSSGRFLPTDAATLAHFPKVTT